MSAVTATTHRDTAINFSDVPKDAWFYEQVHWAVDQKITSGTSATTFSPDATCTTAQILTFLWISKGCPEPTISNPFSDVKSSDYFYKPALWASEKGLVSGSAFKGSTPCTRAQIVTFLYNAYGR